MPWNVPFQWPNPSSSNSPRLARGPQGMSSSTDTVHVLKAVCLSIFAKSPKISCSLEHSSKVHGDYGRCYHNGKDDLYFAVEPAQWSHAKKLMGSRITDRIHWTSGLLAKTPWANRILGKVREQIWIGNSSIGTQRSER